MAAGALKETAALVCLGWAATVTVVQGIGIAAILRYYSRPPRPSVSSKLGRNAPAVTIIRPVKGLDPCLYDCIASTFQQDYPADRVSVRLCVADESDAAYPMLQKLVAEYSALDAQVLVESRDPALHGPDAYLNLGPNPKVRNISRAYREATGDIIWIIDCNVWVAPGVLGRMVDKLTGRGEAGPTTPYKFVHQMPLVVDVDGDGDGDGALGPIGSRGGGRLDEMFMATSHAKFYGAINSVGVAPCIVGKSNMFRKSHLDQATMPRGKCPRPSGVDYFSYNICEDHLIGDLLWRSDMPGHCNHGMVWGDLVVQPTARMSVASYAGRRVRWLRARKFTVLMATLAEPGVESLVCCGYLAFALTTLPWFREHAGIPQTWAAMGLVWAASVAAWMLVDWATFRRLHSGRTVVADERTPRFARGTSHAAGMPARPLGAWALAWLGREAMALPIWTWAVLLGTTVNWRGKTFHVRPDTSVVDLTDEARQGSKARRD